MSPFPFPDVAYVWLGADLSCSSTLLMPRSVMFAATLAFSRSRVDLPVLREEAVVDAGDRTLLPASLSEWPLELRDTLYWPLPTPPTTDGARLLPLRTDLAVMPPGVKYPLCPAAERPVVLP